MSDDKRETAERPAIEPKKMKSSLETGRLSDLDQARGYIAGFLEFDYLDDLAAVLQAAEQITGGTWAVVVTSEGAEIKNLDTEEMTGASAGDDGDESEGGADEVAQADEGEEDEDQDGEEE